jgi:hypothetical protein
MSPERTLLFVFNINTGNLSGRTDYHQSPGTTKEPRCHLFELIFSPVGMKKGWKRFLNELPLPSRLLFLDEFQVEFGIARPSVPVVYLQSAKSLQELITTDELQQIPSTDLLIDLVTRRLHDALQHENG